MYGESKTYEQASSSADARCELHHVADVFPRRRFVQARLFARRHLDPMLATMLSLRCGSLIVNSAMGFPK